MVCFITCPTHEASVYVWVLIYNRSRDIILPRHRLRRASSGVAVNCALSQWLN